MRRGECFFRAPDTNGWYGFILLARCHGTLLAAMVFGFLVVVGTWWSVALALLELAVYLWPGWYRVGLLVSRRGVSARVPPGVGWHLPWNRIRAIRRTADNAYLDSDDGSRALADMAESWPEAALLCERWLLRRAGQDPDAGLNAISGDDVQEWLRAGRGGALHVRREAAAVPLVAALVGSGPIVLAGLLLSPASRVATLLAGLAIGVVYLSRRAVRASVVTEAHADAEGIRLRTSIGWHSVGWSQLIGATVPISVEPGVLQTDEMRYLLPVSLNHRDQFLNAAQRAIAARREGAVLPRLADGAEVPDGAISRVGPTQAASERGISVVNAGPAPPVE